VPEDIEGLEIPRILRSASGLRDSRYFRCHLFRETGRRVSGGSAKASPRAPYHLRYSNRPCSSCSCVKTIPGVALCWTTEGRRSSGISTSSSCIWLSHPSLPLPSALFSRSHHVLGYAVSNRHGTPANTLTAFRSAVLSSRVRVGRGSGSFLTSTLTSGAPSSSFLTLILRSTAGSAALRFGAIVRVFEV